MRQVECTWVLSVCEVRRRQRHTGWHGKRWGSDDAASDAGRILDRQSSGLQIPKRNKGRQKEPQIPRAREIPLQVRSRLHLEAARLSATTGALELAALGANVGLGVLVGTHAEVLDALTGVLGATEEDGVAASGGTERELVKGEALTAGRKDASAGGLGEAEGGDRELGELEETVVVGDGTNNNDGLGSLALLGDATTVLREIDDARDRDRWAVDLGHEQATEDRLVEAGLRAASQEAVKL